MDWQVVIGLEVHVQVNTITKLFCSCPTKFGMEANLSTCQVCLGYPGVLPCFNEKVLEKAVSAGLALNCEVQEFSQFDRKNYFYPDLPKAYQITQLFHPICLNGFVTIDSKDENKKIRINRIHIEEDAGKLVHSNVAGIEESYVDLNRAGTPLLEIVSEPDISSSEEAVAYLQSLRSILRYIDVSDCNMQEGSLRCDVNLSVKKQGETTLGNRTEIKNMNTFKGIAAAIKYEKNRQISLLEKSEKVVQQTLLWDNEAKKTKAMRSKENLNDYRYFPDPDLPPVFISIENVKKSKEDLVELPNEKQQRFQKQYNLSEYDAKVLTNDKELSFYFEDAVQHSQGRAKKVANWISTEVLSYLNENLIEIKDFSVSSKEIGALVLMMEEGKITGKIAKDIFPMMIESGKTAEEIVILKGINVVSNEEEIEKILQKVIDENPESVAKYKNGQDRILGFFVGQVMKETKGQANPKVVNEIFKKLI